MPDTNWTPGEAYDPGQARSMVRTMQSEATERKDYNRSLVHDAFPSQGTIKGSHEGSQSVAPDSPTTPDVSDWPSWSEDIQKSKATAPQAQEARDVAAKRTQRSVRDKTLEIFNPRINKY